MPYTVSELETYKSRCRNVKIENTTFDNIYNNAIVVDGVT